MSDKIWISEFGIINKSDYENRTIYKCDYCGNEIKPVGNGLVVYSQGMLFCCRKCLANHYDINWIPKSKIPELLGEC